VLVAPKDSAAPHSFEELTGDQVKLIALGDPASVPAGDYGRQVLEALRLWGALQPKLVLAKDVRQVLAYVETANTDAGIVYETDARESNKVRLAAIAPPETHKPIVYPVAVVKDSRNVPAARSFIDFLAGSAAGEIFRRHGFTTVTP
jgi:molybdate transport system substrate-binding protein